MQELYITLVIMVCFLALFNLRSFLRGRGDHRRGELPQKGKVTMFDVRQLLMEGKRDLAIQLYCEIFNVSPLKAKKDVEELARSLKV